MASKSSASKPPSSSASNEPNNAAAGIDLNGEDPGQSVNSAARDIEQKLRDLASHKRKADEELQEAQAKRQRLTAMESDMKAMLNRFAALSDPTSSSSSSSSSSSGPASSSSAAPAAATTDSSAAAAVPKAQSSSSSAEAAADAKYEAARIAFYGKVRKALQQFELVRYVSWTSEHDRDNAKRAAAHLSVMSVGLEYAKEGAFLRRLLVKNGHHGEYGIDPPDRVEASQELYQRDMTELGFDDGLAAIGAKLRKERTKKSSSNSREKGGGGGGAGGRRRGGRGRGGRGRRNYDRNDRSDRSSNSSSSTPDAQSTPASATASPQKHEQPWHYAHRGGRGGFNRS